MRNEASPRQGNNSELPPGMRPPSETGSGVFKSSLDKAVGKDIKISPDRKWALDLMRQVPHEQLEVIAGFLETVADNKRTEAAQTLLHVIHEMSGGILHARDQAQALKDCLEEVQKRLQN